MRDSGHQARILDQFTRQATPFSTASPITDAGALAMIVAAAAPRATDTVLDVACGGGIIVCALARDVLLVTARGISGGLASLVTARDHIQSGIEPSDLISTELLVRRGGRWERALWS